MKESVWHGCYDKGWNNVISPPSFAHPAKMARGLLERIIDHGIEQGYWTPGISVLGDPFGGIGSTGIICSYRGLSSVSLELEPRFHALALANAELHRRTWETLGAPMPVYLCGDSRWFAKIVGEVPTGSLDGVCTSPPYAETTVTGESNFKSAKRLRDSRGSAYGQTEGQIGRLRAGELDGAVTSPPEDYWMAMSRVYAQLLLALKPGGVAALVLKSFVKNKQIVDLPAQTCQLLTHLGFDVFEMTRAMLVKETVENTLFDGPVKKLSEKKSFFRRMAEKKGSPRIDYEVVIWARRPAHRATEGRWAGTQADFGKPMASASGSGPPPGNCDCSF